MTGFELQTSGIGSDRSINWATTTAALVFYFLYSTWGLFHKTLWIRKLRICNYGQILTVNLLVNCQNSVIYGHFVVNYLEKSFMEQAADV